MLAPVFDIDVKINNEPVPTDTIDDLRQLYEYLGQFLHWLDEVPQFNKLRFNKSDEVNATASQITKPSPPHATVATDTAKTIKPVLSAGQKLTTTQYAILALGLHDGSAPSITAMNTAKELGWYTRSKDEKNARRTFEIMTRQNQSLITMSKGIMRLTPAGREAYEQLKAFIYQESSVILGDTRNMQPEESMDIDDVFLIDDDMIILDEDITQT